MAALVFGGSRRRRCHAPRSSMPWRPLGWSSWRR